MKRIAIFCDGTWNVPHAEYPTNVMLLARAAKRTSPDGIVQNVIYIPGVGSGRGATRVQRWADRILGGVFGLGLFGNIEEAYRHLAFNYEPGDEILIFGFSRGAFTARSLAGLIRSCGIPPERNIRRIPEAMDAYRARGETNRPDKPGPMKFRHAFSPNVATSEFDLSQRDAPDDVTLLKIAYLGIWDTVGSLGIPVQLRGLLGWWNRKYRFHDLELSRMVTSARHAVAVDERRKNFLPTLWSNIDRRNGGPQTKDSLYQELWFSGDHGSVGGGGDIRGLSAITLDWIAKGAEDMGMAFDQVRLAEFAEEQDYLEPSLFNQSGDPSPMTEFMRRFAVDREPPASEDRMYVFARNRMRKIQSYRPKTLKPFWPPEG